MSPPPRVLLLTPAESYRLEPFAAAARELGVELRIASDRCHVLAAHWGTPLAVDFNDEDGAAAAILAHAAREPFAGVVATDDRSTVLASRVAVTLGLAGNPGAATVRARSKLALRETLAAAGLRQPSFRVIEPGTDGAAIADAAAALGFPVVVKPLLLSGSRGVIRADDRDQTIAAAARVRAILARTGGPQRGERDGTRLLVERFVPGVEVALEGFLAGGQLEVLALFDKPDPLDGPFFEETLYVTPSRLADAAQTAIAAEAGRAAAALGLLRGPVHAELRMDDAAVTVIELAARSIGGLCSRTLRLGTGLTLEALILLDALGRPLPEHGRERAAAGVLMLPIPRRGYLREVRGLEAARAVPGIESIEITAPFDHELVPLPEGASYLGFAFARGDDPATVEQALRRAHARLELVIAPALAR